MKNLIITILILLLAKPLSAQVETLYDGKIVSGWYGSPVFKIGQIHDQTGYFLGAEGGWIINHQFVIGAKGYMLVNPVEVAGLQNISFGFGGGGLLLKYILKSDTLVHFDIEGMIGAGGVYNDLKDSAKPHDPIAYTGDGCFILEPGANAVLNISENFRIGIGATYRLTNGLDYDAAAPFQHSETGGYQSLSNSDVSGFSAQLTFKYGNF